MHYNAWFATLVDQQYIGSTIYIWYADCTCSKFPHLNAKKESPLAATDDKLIYIDPSDNIVVYNIATKASNTLYHLKLEMWHSIAGLAVYDHNFLVCGLNYNFTFATQCGAATNKTCEYLFFNLSNSQMIAKKERPQIDIISLGEYYQQALFVFKHQYWVKPYFNLRDLNNISASYDLPWLFDSSIGLIPIENKQFAYVIHDNPTKTSEIYIISTS